MYSLEECERLWDEVGQHGEPEERVRRARAWLPYYAYIAEPMLRTPFSLEHTADGFPAYLIRDGLCLPAGLLLDIVFDVCGGTLD